MDFQEVVASLSRWDLLDDGVDRVLDTSARETLVTATHPVALLHDKVRPLIHSCHPYDPRCADVLTIGHPNDPSQ